MGRDAGRDGGGESGGGVSNHLCPQLRGSSVTAKCGLYGSHTSRLTKLFHDFYNFFPRPSS